jgi:translation initiation factor IF-3
LFFHWVDLPEGAFLPYNNYCFNINFLKSLKKKFYRVNMNIRVPEVFLVGENGDALGRVSLSEALRLSTEAELDLVEIAPEAKPPVCKIIDFGKFKYELEKQEKKQRAKNKSQDMKEIRLSMRIEEHDLDMKLRQAEDFLRKQHKLKISLRLQGREMAFLDKAREKINSALNRLAPLSKVEQPIKKLGKQFIVILAPDLGRKKEETQELKEENTPANS